MSVSHEVNLRGIACRLDAKSVGQEEVITASSYAKQHVRRRCRKPWPRLDNGIRWVPVIQGRSYSDEEKLASGMTCSTHGAEDVVI